MIQDEETGEQDGGRFGSTASGDKLESPIKQDLREISFSSNGCQRLSPTPHVLPLNILGSIRLKAIPKNSRQHLISGFITKKDYGHSFLLGLFPEKTRCWI
jgi:hypothetical protein